MILSNRYAFQTCASSFISFLSALFFLFILLPSCTTPSILVTREQQQGDACNNQNKYQEAIVHYRKSLNASSQLGIYRNQDMEGVLCRKLANAYETQGNYTEALGYINRAYFIDSIRNNKLEYIEDVREKGRIYLFIGNYKVGMAYLEYSLKLNEGMENSLKTANKLSIANTYFSLGETNLVLGKYNEAIVNINKAISLYSENNNWQGLMESELVMAEILIDFGDYEQAKKLLLKSMKRAEENKINTARQNQALGEIAGMTGEYEKELKYRLVALDEANKTNITPQIIWAMVKTGDAYFSLNDMKRANGYYSGAIKLKQSKNINAQGIDASINMRTGNALSANKFYISAGSQLGSSLALLRMAETYIRHKQPDSAMYCYNQTLQYFTQSNIKEGIAKVNLLKGKFYIESDSLSKASQCFDLAQNYTRKPEILWQYWFHKGRLSEKYNQLDSAKNAYLKSIDIIENLRSKISLDELKSTFTDAKIEVYDRLIMLLLKMGLNNEAYDISERARSRAFLDMISNKKIEAKDDKDKDLIGKEQASRLQIMHLSQLIEKYELEENLADSSAMVKYKQIKEEYANAQLNYDELLQKLKLNKSSYTSLIVVETASIKDIQKSLDNKTALVEYWVGTSKLIAWVISNKKISTKIIDIRGDDLRDDIMTSRFYLGKSTDKVYYYVKHDYESLILPIEDELKGFPFLCIVPHNVLHLLPFQALMNSNDQFMFENFSISYAPSGSIYLKCLQASANTANKFLGMALGDLEINQFSGLPGTSLEVEQISRLYPEETVKLKEETTESFLKQEASKFNIIHLATHGYFNGNDPMNSFVLFAPSKDDDGKLMVREVFGLNLNSKLVTLSACETGITSITQGDEMVGLSRAFIYAGTPSIIVSLWNVSDASTTLLMEKFYKNLQSHNLHEALTLAQKDLIQQYRLPFYWAPFVLIGNGKIR